MMKNDLPPIDFTLREIENILWLKQGLTSKEIAEKLGVSHLTIRKHRKNILAKFGGKGKSEFMAFLRNYPPLLTKFIYINNLINKILYYKNSTLRSIESKNLKNNFLSSLQALVSPEKPLNSRELISNF